MAWHTGSGIVRPAHNIDLRRMPGGVAHIGSGNENRYALLLTPEGGRLVRTPASTPSANQQVRIAKVSLTSGGEAVAEIDLRFTGNQQDNVRQGLGDALPEEKEKWLKEYLEVPSYEIVKFDFSGYAPRQDSVSIAVKISMRRFASMAGTCLLFQPNLLEHRFFVPPGVKKRTQPVVRSYPYIDIDTIAYQLPASYHIEAMPKPASIQTSFASYACGLHVARDGTLTYTRRLEMRAPELPPEKYEDYRGFWKEVVKADKANLALAKN